MFSSRFTDLVGCDYPIQQAGFGASAVSRLAAAVSNAGGLGMIGGVMLPPDRVFEEIEATQKLTDRPFGINFICEFLDRSIVKTVAQQCRVVEFFWGDPEPDLVEAVHSGGALAAWQVGSASEGIRAAEVGCDLVVAQGVEAGGHVRGLTGLSTLLEELHDQVDVVLVGAGGIGSGRKMVAAMVAGADAVRVGTRFLAAEESDAHEDYKAALTRASGEDTVLTRLFRSGWDKPHRVLQTSIDAASALEDGAIIGEIEIGGVVHPVDKFNVQAPTVEARGNIEAMAMYAGESVGFVRKVSPASEIVSELITEAEAVMAEQGANQ